MIGQQLSKRKLTKTFSTIQLEGTEISADDAKKSAEIVAKTIVWNKMESLGNHALGEIQDWSNDDETIVKQLRPLLTTTGQLPESFASAGIYAAHAVAATVMEALSKDADIPLLFSRMLGMLKAMHDANPAWGPLYVAHPGNMKKDFIYCRGD